MNDVIDRRLLPKLRPTQRPNAASECAWLLVNPARGMLQGARRYLRKITARPNEGVGSPGRRRGGYAAGVETEVEICLLGISGTTRAFI